MSGFTSWPLPGDAKRVYVSATGSDSNDGLTELTPKLTLSAGRALLTTGKGDHLCLKCGDTWSNQTFGTWGATSGKNASEPIVITYYGTGARPIVQWDGNPGAGNDKTLLMLSNTAVISHIAVVGIHFRAINYGGDSAVNGGILPLYYLSTGSNLTIEDCVFEGGNNNVIVQGLPANPGLVGLTIRRNIFGNPFLTNAGGTNLYFDGCGGTILIEENVYYQTDANETAGNKLSHNLYMSETAGATAGDITVRNNILYNARSNLTIRLSATVENNLCIKAAANGIGIGYDDFPVPAPVECMVGWNIVTESRPHWNGQHIGWGIVLRNCDRTFVYRNIVMRSTEVMENHFAFNLGASCRYCVIRDNFVYDWKDEGSTNAISALIYLNQVTGPVLFLNNTFDQPVENWILSAETAGPTAIDECTFTGNRYNAARSSCFYNVGAANDTIAEWIANIDTTGTSGAPSYPDISRTVGKYYLSLGGTDSTEAFVVAAATRGLGEWDEAYTAASANAWIRAGYYAMSYTQEVCDEIWNEGTRALLAGSPHAAGDYLQSVVNEVWDETTRELTIPDAPTAVYQGVEIGTAHATQATFSWTAASGITDYRFKYGTTAGNYTTSEDVAALTITITGLTPLTRYYGVVVSVEDGIESDPTAEFYWTTGPQGAPQTDGTRIYGTFGTNVPVGGFTDWTSPGNCNGNAANDASPATLALASAASGDSLGLTIPATPIEGVMVGVKIGVRIGATVGPHASSLFTIGALSGTGWYLKMNDDEYDDLDAATITDREYTCTLAYGTWAALQADIEAGLALSANHGILIGCGSSGGNTTFAVVEAWLVPVLAGGGSDGDSPAGVARGRDRSRGRAA